MAVNIEEYTKNVINLCVDKEITPKGIQVVKKLFSYMVYDPVKNIAVCTCSKEELAESVALSRVKISRTIKFLFEEKILFRKSNIMYFDLNYFNEKGKDKDANSF